jgi:dihydroorotate dehydrogenase electron transfer subunit
MHHCHSRRTIRYSKGTVVRNVPIAENTWRITIDSEEPLPEVRAGQFAMLRLPNRTDPLLARPFAVYLAEAHRFEAVYLTVGKMTRLLAAVRTNDPLEFWLPLGNGFSDEPVQHTILVAGGIGQTPFLMYCRNARKRGERITLLYGVRTAARTACMDDFRGLGITPVIAADDGSAGYHGLVTDLIEPQYHAGELTKILACGPLPMLRSVFFTAKKLGLPCSVSLETPMSCGLGICFGCVVPYRENDDTLDYRRTCTEGPVFDAYKLQW